MFKGVSPKIGVVGALNTIDNKKFLRSIKKTFKNAALDLANGIGLETKIEKRTLSFNFTSPKKCSVGAGGTTSNLPSVTWEDYAQAVAEATLAGQEANSTHIQALMLEKLISVTDKSNVYQIFNSRHTDETPISSDFLNSTNKQSCFEACYYAYDLFLEAGMIDPSDELCCGHERLNDGANGKCEFGFNGRESAGTEDKSATLTFVVDFENIEEKLEADEVCDAEDDKVSQQMKQQQHLTSSFVSVLIVVSTVNATWNVSITPSAWRTMSTKLPMSATTTTTLAMPPRALQLRFAMVFPTL